MMDRGEQKVIELVNAWAKYSEATPDADLAGFCLQYLTENAPPMLLDRDRPVVAVDDVYDEKWGERVVDNTNRALTDLRPEARLAALVGRLSKYAHFYSKKAMQPHNFKSIEEPVYLIVLLKMGTPKKSTLIYEMLAEFASGIDVINRLVEMGYIEEFPDETDRRSKRLRITEAGLNILQQCLPTMNRVADVAYSSLTDNEQTLLIQILNKLDRYHAEHYKQSKNAEFDDVYDRMAQ